MAIPKFQGDSKNGKLILDKRDAFIRYLFSIEGRIELVAKKYKKDRSLEQNRYYWALINMICEHTGDDKDSMHFYLSDKFLSFHTMLLDEEIKVVPSTTKLKTNEFVDYLSKIKMWASKELSLYLPDPDELSYK